LDYTIDEKSTNLADNLFSVHNPRIFFINIKTFLTKVRYENDQYYNYDLREPKRQIVNPNKLKETRKVVSTTDDWSNIPYYPTTKERREQLANEYISRGQPVPKMLLEQLEQDKIDDIKEDAYNKDIDIDMNMHIQTQNNHNHSLNNNHNHVAHNHNHATHNHTQKIMNKYSPDYANYIGVKPRATASAKMRLGCIY